MVSLLHLAGPAALLQLHLKILPRLHKIHFLRSCSLLMTHFHTVMIHHRLSFRLPRLLHRRLRLPFHFLLFYIRSKNHCCFQLRDCQVRHLLCQENPMNQFYLLLLPSSFVFRLLSSLLLLPLLFL